jgi:lipopolysaccharide transport system ATP-binding protein
MTEAIITVEGLGKKYRISHQRQNGMRYKSLRDVIAEKATKLFTRNQKSEIRSKTSDLRPPASSSASLEDFWALRDVSFEVKQGEVVGIIGRNGAGKSTLLKILSRITEPTEGEVRIRGRVASLLEVGTGFHPELTGRENVFLNGAILGMTRVEIKRKFDEIVAFAEVEKFLDTPVKRYSSGMYVRLAFAVAAHLEPEILIVDEVLAVGDAEFQKKCLGKMQDVSKGGRTVLFVSHNMAAVKSLCKRAVLLRGGVLSLDGNTDHVVGEYLGNGSTPELELIWKDFHQAPGNGSCWLRRLAVETEPHHPNCYITTASSIRIVAEYWNEVDDAELNLSLVLYTADDICVFNTWSQPKRLARGFVRGVCQIPPHLLNDERYRIRLLIVRDSSVALMDQDNLLWFDVKEDIREGNWFGKIVGAIRPQLKWDTTTLDLPA